MLGVIPDEDVPSLLMKTTCGQLTITCSVVGADSMTMKRAPLLDSGTIVGGKPIRTGGASRRRGAEPARQHSSPLSPAAYGSATDRRVTVTTCQPACTRPSRRHLHRGRRLRVQNEWRSTRVQSR